MTIETIEFDEGWNSIDKGIKKLIKILERQVIKQSFQRDEYMLLYTTVYNLCNQKVSTNNYLDDDAPRLYENYRKLIEEYVTLTVLPSITKKHGEFMLMELVTRWNTHEVMVRLFLHLFNYLTRYYVNRLKIPTLREVGITCFKDLVYEEVKDKVRDIVMVLIEKERKGEMIGRALMKKVVEVFLGMGMGENVDCYEEDFEVLMVVKTGTYYSRKAANWVLEDSFPDYMLEAEECLKKERERVSHYLHWSTENKLVESVQHELLMVHETKLIKNEDSGVRALPRDDKVEHLSRMFSLYHVVPGGLEPIANLFRQHITDLGTSLVQQAESACSDLVRKLIKLHDKYMEYVISCFLNHTLLHKALKEAFEVFCNKTIAGSTSSAELFASFCDEILKNSGVEKLSDEAIEETLENFVNMLVYIIDKDLFAEFYHKKLSRRLLFSQSTDMDREKCMLTKLKQQFGAPFTSRMEGMVTDFTLTKDKERNFDAYIKENPYETPGIDLSVSVLTTRFWPNYKSFDLNLPAEMAKCVETFSRFYRTQTQRRKLTWIYSLGSCIVRGKFTAKTIELIVPTYQAAALLLFNNADKLTYDEIMNELNITSPDLDRLLHSLACAKYEILKKEPRNKTISPTDIFEFNSTFTNPMRRIGIPLPPIDDRKKVIEDVERDRRYTIEAAIIRIMKSRKVLSHQKLVVECIEQLGRMFKPDMKAMKKRIEDLISRDYLERDGEDANVLKYIA